ncbi:MAG: KEOPS complex kinase/ATPase Bud32 [Candidatus Bilamarchaeaceae archaeon]
MGDRIRGAEATVKRVRFFGKKTILKKRMEKKYRLKEIDTLLRRQRTKAEARLLHRAKMANVPCPTVLYVDDFSIIMTLLSGKRPTMNMSNARIAGIYLARLHNHGIIHGDYTPANLIKAGKRLFVIDFGLGFFSTDIEDMATDVFTMLKAINNGRSRKSFLSGYRVCKRFSAVMARVEDIKKRIRYA